MHTFVTLPQQIATKWSYPKYRVDKTASEAALCEVSLCSRIRCGPPKTGIESGCSSRGAIPLRPASYNLELPQQNPTSDRNLGFRKIAVQRNRLQKVMPEKAFLRLNTAELNPSPKAWGKKTPLLQLAPTKEGAVKLKNRLPQAR